MSLLKTNKITDVAGNVIAEPRANENGTIIAGPGILSNAPYVLARLDRTNEDIIIVDNTETVLPFGVVDAGVQENFNITSDSAQQGGRIHTPHSFCANEGGRYQCNFMIKFADSDTSSDFEVILRIKLGFFATVYAEKAVIINKGNETLSWSGVIPIASQGDAVSAHILFNKGSNSLIKSTQQLNYFEFYRLLGV